VHRQITDDLLIPAVTDQAVSTEGGTRPWVVRDFGGNVVVVVGFLDPHYFVVGEVQDVCRYDDTPFSTP
jgi:hypothetical protein